jgi:virulence factor Mce-like protein
VKIVMSVQKTTKLPTGVKAYLMAPNVVNDRFIELDPGYTGGSSLPPGTTLPVEQTVVPQSVDQIVASIDRLATDLGPSGANEDGSLSRLLRSIAETLGGSGNSLNSSVRDLGKVFAAVSNHTDDVTSMLNDLGGVTHAAAGVSGKYQQLAGDLAQVSTTLADNDVAIASSVKNLARVLAALNTFVKDNKSQLKGTLGSMSKIAGAVGRQQQALSTSMRLLPLAVDNAGRTVTNGGVRTRFDQVVDAKLHGQICGDGVLRLLLLSLSPQRDHDKVMDLACGTNELLLSLRAGPGAPSAALLTRDALQSMGGHR